MFADINDNQQFYTQMQHYNYRKQFIKHLYENKDDYRTIKIVYGSTQFFMVAQDNFHEQTNYKISKHFFNLIIKYDIDFDPITEEIYFSNNAKRLPQSTNQNHQFKNITVDDICYTPNNYK